MIKPPRLQKGDTVAAISLSWGGAGDLPHRYRAGVQQIESEFGINVVPTKHALRGHAFLRNNPEARAADLHEALTDPNVKGIISTIGGDDSIRCLPYLDLELIRQNPKIFLGFSDTTVHHFAWLAAGVTSFYGPSILAGFAENCGMFPYTTKDVRRTLFSESSIGPLEENQDGWTVEHLDWTLPQNQFLKRELQPFQPWRWLPTKQISEGKQITSGHLIGGCLEVIDWLRGTNIWPSRETWNGAVLFLETSEERPSPNQVTRMLRSCAAAGMFVRPAGLLLGRPCTADPSEADAFDESVVQFVRQELQFSDVPIVSRMDFGHTSPTMTLPLGVQAEINCINRSVSLRSGAVT